MVFKLLLIVAAVQLMFCGAAAITQSDLTCAVTRQSDGGFMYELSRPPGSSNCRTGWEDENNTVIAQDTIPDPELVVNLTDRFINLNVCRDYLHYTRDCAGFEEAHCRVNCSKLLLEEDRQTKHVNETLICISGTWCPNQLMVGLGITGVLCAVGLVLGLLLLFFKSRRRRSAYRAPPDVEMEAVEISNKKNEYIHDQNSQTLYIR